MISVPTRTATAATTAVNHVATSVSRVLISSARRAEALWRSHRHQRLAIEIATLANTTAVTIAIMIMNAIAQW